MKPEGRRWGRAIGQGPPGLQQDPVGADRFSDAEEIGFTEFPRPHRELVEAELGEIQGHQLEIVLLHLLGPFFCEAPVKRSVFQDLFNGVLFHVYATGLSKKGQRKFFGIKKGDKDEDAGFGLSEPTVIIVA
jgi:hypothetical protein